MQIGAILSDYDGTLSPTTFFNSDDKTVRIPNHHSQTELDRILWEISSRRTIAIVSTKDFNFLHRLIGNIVLIVYPDFVKLGPLNCTRGHMEHYTNLKSLN